MISFIVSLPCKIPSASRPRALTAYSFYGQTRVSLSTSTFRGARISYQPTFLPLQGLRPMFQPSRAMFSGGGILGVGASEIVVIVAVGWLLLGPQKLFSLAKDSGRIIGELRRTATEARETFTEAMEMDILATEAETLANQVSNAGKDKEEGGKENTANELSKVEGTKGEDVAQTSVEEAITSSMESAPSASPSATVSTGFLDQLKRAADPNQVAPPDIPDLSVEDDEEKEFEKLEQEYLAAKSRMERRKSKINSETVSDSTAAGNER